MTGHDRSPIELASRTVRQLYAPPFQAAVREAGVKSAMEVGLQGCLREWSGLVITCLPGACDGVRSFRRDLLRRRQTHKAYTEVSGVPMASNKEYLVDLLREEMGFDGMLVTDYNEV